MSDTIFALSSGQGRAGIAVLRMSGAGVRRAFESLCGGVPSVRLASLRNLRDPRSREIIDRGICLFFEAPRSFTGEDMGELHVHGGRAVVERIVEALGSLAGFRPADAGEFSRRAFVNGKLDLIGVEALGDIIAARTKGQLELAQRLASGALSQPVERWLGQLVSLMALVEAHIDFADEEDVAHSPGVEVRRRAEELRAEIEATLNDGRRGERLREGVSVVIAGPPNAGKSTLLNLLAKREAAIVSPIAGTTRDIIEVELDLGGVPVRVADTAGLRERGSDEIEAIGVDRARQRIAAADLVLWLESVEGGVASLEVRPMAEGKLLRVKTKADLADGAVEKGWLEISAVTGSGIEALVETLTGRVRELAGVQEGVVIAHARQRAALEDCARELGRLVAGEQEGEIELEAERLRLAARALERLMGRVDVEEVLGRIFASFCIGK